MRDLIFLELINKINLKKGLDIPIYGKADHSYIKSNKQKHFAIKPTDFIGVIPKLIVKENDLVKAGSSLFFDKNNPEIFFSSPISGKVVSIKRGLKRVIEEIIILSDEKYIYEDFQCNDIYDRTKLVKTLLSSGLWPLIRQKPYSTIPNYNDIPKSIFISSFDSSPLAPSYDFILKDYKEDFQFGIDVISRLTKGKLYLNIDSSSDQNNIFNEITGVVKTIFSGPHPCGNVGVQIHHIEPINKGESVWYINPQDVVTIARLFKTGKVNPLKTIAITGSEVVSPKYIKANIGSSIKELLENNVRESDNRIISGNILTGKQVDLDGFIGYYDSQITVLNEGNNYRLLGWLFPSSNIFSVSPTFLSSFLRRKKFKFNTNNNGENRPFVVSGQYEKVFPMNIYPVQLIKSILIEDIDKMEELGIYEVSEEDLALCEFVCTSKINVQDIIRRGLNLVKSECG